MNEVNMLLLTGGHGAINNRQNNCRIVGSGGVVHLCTTIVVKWQDRKICEVAPVAIKVAVPITKDTIDIALRLSWAPRVSSIMQWLMPSAARAVLFFTETR
jgi:hypothetical protein